MASPLPMWFIDCVTDRVVGAVAELPDRTSPDDWHDAMLVTADELREIVKAAIGSLLVRAERGEGPPWWCEVCDSWRFTKNCGRDECPAPAPTLTNGHERSCQTQQKGAYPHCTCAPCAQHCAYRDPIVMAADAAKAACIRRLQRAISDIGRRGMLPLNADECVAILERMTWEGEMPIATACPKCGGVGVVAGDDPTCLACLGSGKAEP
jgi:hypothetical protein